MFLWLFDEMKALVMIVLSFWYGFVVFAQEQWRNSAILAQARHSPKRELQKFATGLRVEHLARRLAWCSVMCLHAQVRMARPSEAMTNQGWILI